MTTKLALVLAILFGFLAVIGLRSWMATGEQQQQEQFVPKNILVASQRIPAGEPLTLERMSMGEIPVRFVKRGMISWDERTRHLGKVATQDIDRGAIILESELASKLEGQRGTMAVVNTRMRAVTLRVDQVSGNAGLLKPGEYVDVIGTFDVQRIDPQAMAISEGRAVLAKKTETVYLLQAARILAIDAQTSPVGTRGGANYRTVTLEVSPRDALRLTNAMNQARIQLMLRNPGDPEVVAGTNPDTGLPTLHIDVTDEVKRTTPFSTN